MNILFEYKQETYTLHTYTHTHTTNDNNNKNSFLLFDEVYASRYGEKRRSSFVIAVKKPLCFKKFLAFIIPQKCIKVVFIVDLTSGRLNEENHLNKQYTNTKNMF